MSTLSKISTLSKFNDIKDKELTVFGYFEDIGLSKIGKKINEAKIVATRRHLIMLYIYNILLNFKCIYLN